MTGPAPEYPNPAMEKIAHAVVNPLKSLNLLSRADIEGLTSRGGDLFVPRALSDLDQISNDAVPPAGIEPAAP